MTSAQSLDVSLTGWASIATIVVAIITVVGALVAFIKPIRQFLGKRRFFRWILTRKDRDEMQKGDDEQKARGKAKRANLQFELRSDGVLPGVAELVTLNNGPCEARNVAIYGELNPSLYWDYKKQNALRDSCYGLVQEYGTISPEASRVEEGLSISTWQIVGGVARWNLRTDWDDDAGRHYNQPTEARKR